MRVTRGVKHSNACYTWCDTQQSCYTWSDT